MVRVKRIYDRPRRTTASACWSTASGFVAFGKGRQRSRSGPRMRCRAQNCGAGSGLEPDSGAQCFCGGGRSGTVKSVSRPRRVFAGNKAVPAGHLLLRLCPLPTKGVLAGRPSELKTA
jgi:hypothetical protein